ncbi:tRNA (adenosine(37)-N6)-threonylcarbamoyltransferase complex dimerization subunit type 1 TsaB [Dongia deserti]|uniref:tRNA (adenosine(37)-N6)-threonylcarbamoyltransferase complex dimerization subunit type 1 TsaB n=1 Tax=Dongia deserti TaxID=2268030 RepID=UPI000E65B550|nr:tRNA (adenosine(37)-N6)-threonylcarbamoyltransferase complex dimerization subunit type 1 TsaB [Dongia deserti]
MSAASTPPLLSAPLLAIETAGSACSVAIRLSAERPPAHEIMATSHGHATALAPMIRRLAQATGIDLKSLKAIAVSCGPGGFTGIRVGLSTARAMALAIGCPIVGIGSFQALAATAARSGGKLAVCNLVVLDSRRSELFAVELGPDLQPLSPAALLTAAEIETRCKAGDIALIADAELTQFAALGGLSASADAIAVAELAATRPDLLQSAEPIYLRPPDISQPRPRKP